MKVGLMCRASRHPIEAVNFKDKKTGEAREMLLQRMLLVDPQFPEEALPFKVFISSREEAYQPGVDYQIPTTAFQTDERGSLVLNSRFRIEPVSEAGRAAPAGVLKTA